MENYLIIILFIFCLTSCGGQVEIKEVFVQGNGSEINDFYIMQYNTTVREYKSYLKQSGEKFNFDEWVYYDGALSKFITSDDCAMSHVTVLDMVKYANWLSKRNGFKEAYKVKKNKEIILDEHANGYRIPFEKEWKWAAKGGVKSKGYKYCGSDNPDEIAWYGQNAKGMIQSPGLKKPNELGIYDLYGNVSEIMWDVYVYFPPNITLTGENKTDISLWQNKLISYRNNEYKGTEPPYVIRIEELMAIGIPLNQQYVSKNMRRPHCIMNVKEFWSFNEKTVITGAYDGAGFIVTL